jgi:uncharacterized protein YbjT (DUF2867 family)
MPSQLDVVTGAFGYTGAAIARRLLAAGRAVRTLTNHPKTSSPLAASLEIGPLDFADPTGLRRNLEGAEVLYNTYWIRFPYDGMTFDSAVANSRILFEAAKQAGVRRIIHISVSNPSEDSPLAYFKGKAQVERAVRESGLPYAILRPTLIYGPGDILINNIAWMLRKFPVFALPKMGNCMVQPVSAEDVAELAFKLSQQSENVVADAAGPEIYAFKEFVVKIAQAVHRKSRFVHIGRRGLMIPLKLLSWLTGDVVLTRQELEGLAANLLLTSSPPLCNGRFSEWLSENANEVGQRYASELMRHFRSKPS